MKKVLLFLPNGFETFEASVFIDVIGWNYVEGDKSTQLFTCGITKEVNTSFNQKMVVDYIIDQINIDDFEALAIPGGFEVYGFYKDGFDQRFLDLIKQFDDKGKVIASICVGALPLGKSGILNGRNATTYNLNGAVRQKQLSEFGVNLVNEPIVIDRNVITSWNPSTAMGVAFQLLETLTNKENCRYIKSIMGF